MVSLVPMASDKNVTALRGGPVLRPEPNEGCIAYLKDMLEKAEAGEITGFVAASLHGDGLASYTIAGMIGPYALLGGLEMAKMELMQRMQEHLE